jgi:glycosyltransferase involved in cell wall biosynthesis
MVIAVFYPYIGGAEKQALNLARKLLGEKIKVSIITGRWSNSLKKYESLDGIRIYRNLTSIDFISKKRVNISYDIFKIRHPEENSILNPVKLLLQKLSIRLSIYIYQLSLFIFLLHRRKSYDIIHVHQVLFPAFISTICAKILKKPVIAKIGSSGFNSDIKQIKKYPEGRFQLKFILNNINRIIYTSNIMREEFIEQGADRDKLVFLPNGVYIPDFKRSYTECKNLLYLGRFTATKDIEILIKAFRNTLDHYDKINLTLVGDGPEKDSIVRLTKKLGIEKNVNFTGFVDEPGYILKKCDLFVFPSKIEGLPNSLIEAMSYRLPCIATNIPGNLQLLGENDVDYSIGRGEFTVTEYGVLFNTSDVEGLSRAIGFIIENRDIREKLGESSYRRVKKHYDIESISNKYHDLYRELLGNKI